MDHEELVLNVKYLQKVVNNLLQNKSTMSGKPKKGEDLKGGDNLPPLTPPDTTLPTAPVDVTTTEVETDWALKYPKGCDIKSPVTGKLISITRDVLIADPALLAHMVRKHPDEFKTLPAPAEPAE